MWHIATINIINSHVRQMAKGMNEKVYMVLWCLSVEFTFCYSYARARFFYTQIHTQNKRTLQQQKAWKKKKKNEIIKWKWKIDFHVMLVCICQKALLSVDITINSNALWKFHLRMRNGIHLLEIKNLFLKMRARSYSC